MIRSQFQRPGQTNRVAEKLIKALNRNQIFSKQLKILNKSEAILNNKTCKNIVVAFNY